MDDSSPSLARGSSKVIESRSSSHAIDDYHPLARAASQADSASHGQASHGAPGHASMRHSSSIEAPTVRDPSHFPERSESAPAVPPRRIAAGTHSDAHDPAAWTLDDDEVATRGRRSLRRMSGVIVAA